MGLPLEFGPCVCTQERCWDRILDVSFPPPGISASGTPMTNVDEMDQDHYLLLMETLVWRMGEKAFVLAVTEWIWIGVKMGGDRGHPED